MVLGLIKVYSQNITIAAAADLRYVLDDIIQAYKGSHPDAKIDVIYSSSGNLFQQISNQAPFDIFFSADVNFPNKLAEQKLTAGSPKIYGIGRIVLWSSSKDI